MDVLFCQALNIYRLYDMINDMFYTVRFCLYIHTIVDSTIRSESPFPRVQPVGCPGSQRSGNFEQGTACVELLEAPIGIYRLKTTLGPGPANPPFGPAALRYAPDRVYGKNPLNLQKGPRTGCSSRANMSLWNAKIIWFGRNSDRGKSHLSRLLSCELKGCAKSTIELISMVATEQTNFG